MFEACVETTRTLNVTMVCLLAVKVVSGKVVKVIINVHRVVKNVANTLLETLDVM